MTFAEGTTVPVERSRAEIERTLQRYGATAFGYATRDGMAMVEFTISDRHVRMVLVLPSKDERRFTHHSRGARTAPQAFEQWEGACRQRWRALALVVKAKLEAVGEGPFGEFPTRKWRSWEAAIAYGLPEGLGRRTDGPLWQAWTNDNLPNPYDEVK